MRPAEVKGEIYAVYSFKCFDPMSIKMSFYMLNKLIYVFGCEYSYFDYINFKQLAEISEILRIF